MAGESISIPILTPGADAAARNIKQVGNASAEAAGKLDVAAASLEAFNLAAAKSAKADQTLIQSKKAHAKADALLADAENVLAGRATTTTKLFADQGRKLNDVEKAAGNASKGFDLVSNSAGLTTSGMGALIGVGVALSPIIATLGVGLGGLALAALSAGKHSKEFAAELAPLKADLAVFDKQLEPVVLSDFAKAAGVAGNVLHDIEPVAAATGKALGGMLTAVDAEFKSGAWQQFFQFMARTAGPDIELLTDNFVGLLNVLPPLLESLQPVATTLLKDTSGLLNLVSATEKAVEAQHRFAQEASNNTGWLGKLAHAAGQAFNELVPGASGVKHVADELGRLSDNSKATGTGLEHVTVVAAKAGPPFFSLTKAIDALNKSMTTLVGNLLTLQGDNVAWQQSMQAAEKQLKSNTAGLEGNSKNALANKQAIIASTNAAIQFASEQLTLHKNIGGASDTIQAQIRFLQGLHDKSAFVRNELKALREEEARLNRQRINQTVNVQGLGQWSVSQSLAPGAGHRRAAGGMIPGTGSGDTYPALLTPGEVVVPKGMVRAGAVDHLRGSLPGFASGGLVPSYAGNPGGLGPWIRGNDAATIRLMDEAIVRATVAGIHAAQVAASGFGVAGPGGGNAAANAALARRMMPAWASGAEWAAWNYVAMRESGWSQFARNQSSGAYGIPQALPPSKMGPAANPPQSNPAAQISWMIGYIRSRYLDPIGAANHERSFGWYDKGGFLPTGLSLAYNGTGRPEQVIPHGRGAGNSYSITVNAGPTAHKAEIGRVVVEAIREYERRSGKGWRS